MDVLILRLEAPLLSFGAPVVDQHGEIQPYPALSMMAGLIGNALGLDHSEFDRLERLQDRIRYGSRQDRRGRQIEDYQTADLSQPYMDDDRAWTTRGELDERKGGSASTETHIRYRNYWADAIHTVALTLDPVGESPRLEDVERALQHPERPLFIGRKPCLPAASIFVERREARNLVDALQRAPLADRADKRGDGKYPMWWPSGPKRSQAEGTARANIRRPVTDRRDWANQIHVGERWIAQGELPVHEATPEQ
jgi:CRISPR system Cascade subunit CasD